MVDHLKHLPADTNFFNIVSSFKAVFQSLILIFFYIQNKDGRDLNIVSKSEFNNGLCTIGEKIHLPN